MTTRLDPLRGTGRTTRLAAHMALRALVHPGRTVTVHDHHDTVESNGALLSRVSKVLDALGVDYTSDIRAGATIVVKPIRR